MLKKLKWYFKSTTFFLQHKVVLYFPPEHIRLGKKQNLERNALSTNFVTPGTSHELNSHAEELIELFSAIDDLAVAFGAFVKLNNGFAERFGTLYADGNGSLHKCFLLTTVGLTWNRYWHDMWTFQGARQNQTVVYRWGCRWGHELKRTLQMTAIATNRVVWFHPGATGESHCIPLYSTRTWRSISRRIIKSCSRRTRRLAVFPFFKLLIDKIIWKGEKYFYLSPSQS